MTDDSSRDSEASSIASLLNALVETPAAKAPPLELAAGAVVDGRFRVDRVLGQGGTAVVYLARDLTAGHDIALKVGNVVSIAGLRRVEREAQALAKLAHPNVITVHRVGIVEDRMYIAMEYIAGGNARGWLAGARSWRQILRLFAAAGDGLAAAHAAGFVHRDVKPDNILVGDDGRPRVADFGLVAAIDTPPSTAFIALTRTGALMGTPAYMAPEQLAGEPTDARADQFALCASIWEALFGELPFPGDNAASIAAAIVRGPVQPPRDTRGVPRRIVDALRRGLSIGRGERWPSLTPLLAELRRPARNRKLAITGAALLAVVAAVSLIAAHTASPPPVKPAPKASPRLFHRIEIPADRPQRLMTAGHRVTYIANRVDLAELVPWALAEIRSGAPDARLTRITMDDVRRDGTVDLTGPEHLANIPPEIELRFVTHAPDVWCEPRVFARATEIDFDADEGCDEPPVPMPRCTPAAAWGLFLRRHPVAAPSALAHMSYYGDPPIWSVEVDGVHEVFDDVCQ